ncbi:butyrophilin subfamily 1 member A1-like [Saccopteryx leptura]|uniref:butyrophilin subfamily 1 member A1-like n=1 Tax=Saccopteryx leptura TaxID=249018 RepID=UPI00339CF43C
MGSSGLSLPGDLFPILLLHMSMWGSDAFAVIGPAEPIVAMLGGEAVLPCRLAPPQSAERLELRWFRGRFSDAVVAYERGAEQEDQQLAEFRGRVELVRDAIAHGRVAVRIRALQVSDRGFYTCFFKRGSDFEEALLELKVIGLGSGPHVAMVGPEDEGIKLKCTGRRWFPQPEIQWKDARGEKMPSLSEDESQDDDGLFQIEASVIVRDSSKREVSCSMKNPFFGQERVETILIPEPFFPRTSPWKAAFAVTFLILGIFVAAVVFLVWKGKQEKKKIKGAMEEKEKESKDKESFRKELERRKLLYDQDWKKARLYADWRKKHFEAAAVTLDQDTAHAKLVLSDSGKRVSVAEKVSRDEDAPVRQGPEESEIFSVLGQTCFTTGRHYWEAEVHVGSQGGPGAGWALGVCSETAKREGWFVETPEKNFWVVGYREGEMRALTSHPESLSLRQTPNRIGVFLDWEAGDVSFYNMADGSHFYSFTGITFCGTLRPYFSLRGPGTSVAICSATENTQDCFDSSPKTPVTPLRSYDMGVPQEATSLLPP